MCALCGQFLKCSTTYARPDEASVKYGVSICDRLPIHTTLVPEPARVISVFICLGVRFCASSMTSSLLTKVRPRMKLMALILTLFLISSPVAARAHSPAWASPLMSTSRLSCNAPIHGVIFSSSVPGRKPMSSPTATVARVMMTSANRPISRVCCNAAAMVSRVLPVPA